MILKKYKCDVLVIGSGAAGIRAAIEAHDSGCNVIIANKKTLCKSGSSFYQGTSGWGLCAAVQDRDNPENHLIEILNLANGTADENLARVMTSSVKDRITDLEKYGIDFKKKPNGTYLSVKPCFAETERSVSVRGMEKIQNIFLQQVKKRGIQTLQNFTVLGLSCKSGYCGGAYGVGTENHLTQIIAKSTIIATGGGISLFKDNYSIGDLTGDGYSMALDAGANLVNLEFIQFIPATLFPKKGRPFEQRALGYLDHNKSARLIESITKISSQSVENILKDRASHGPFSTKDSGKFFDETLYSTNQENTRLYFTDEIKESNNWVAKDFDQRMKNDGINLVSEGVSLSLYAQAFNGGIYINKYAQTSVNNLFACGETTGGMHGADRMGGCAMASTQVFGKIAGESAAENAKNVHESIDIDSLSEIKNILKNHIPEKVDISQLQKEIQDIISESCNCIRTEQKCINALRAMERVLNKTLESAKYCYDSNDFIGFKRSIECYHMTNSGRAIVFMIKNRKETIGPHYRHDSNIKLQKSSMNTICKKYNKMVVT